MTDAEGPALREMRWWDIPGVLALEKELFPQDAWSEATYWAELAQARGPGRRRLYLVAESDGTLVGYAGLGVAGDTGEVMTIGVTAGRQGAGLGARLLGALLGAAAGPFTCREVLLEVRVDNRPARRLYQRFGFTRVGVRRGYYQPGNHDALVMRRELPAGGALAKEATEGEAGTHG
ncbi:ribosomal protein S18-alanine N-acetyltransferase [Streptomyces sp. MP131-18]|uniref:ribosomal protein S18-alanine N-acetyltransferase n=1 Tax=Streptomyces sp. MP131-18 TaxID=1857892 RepID=UPI00097C3027|nr:ribosomal protein S18-alanine N-acetyltransferase [Streptomyces sp. MP131-18]ONK12018.1 ribosomal-protein-alanine N-acetyltransferase [Streptomyces sp. MP131-18]